MKKGIPVFFYVYLATVMMKPIAYDQVLNVKYHVIAGYLVKNLLANVDVRCLVLQNHAWLHLRTE